MPTGVGAVTVTNDPSVAGLNFVVDPGQFFDLTERNVYSPISFATPGSGASATRQLPQAGILGRLRILFVGELTTTLGGGTVTSRSKWPYGLLDRFVLSANAQNDVFNVGGVDLEALRRIKAANNMGANALDTYPGDVGAGQVIPTGASDVVLTWDVPIAIDPTTLIGGIFAQSPSMNLQTTIREAVTTELLAAAGAATIDSLTGMWTIEVESFDIPIVGTERASLVLPDVSRLHVVNAFQTAYANTGEVPVNLIRGNGQLDRLMVSVAGSDPGAGTTDAYLSVAAQDDELDAIRIEYGNSQRPLDYSPAHYLGVKNIEDYGSALPYGVVVFDFLAENPPRDIIQMAGVTDLRVIPTVDATVVPAAGANVRVVQEMLIGS